jgi:hypothetical protein
MASGDGGCGPGAGAGAAARRGRALQLPRSRPRAPLASPIRSPPPLPVPLPVPVSVSVSVSVPVPGPAPAQSSGRVDEDEDAPLPPVPLHAAAVAPASPPTVAAHTPAQAAATPRTCWVCHADLALLDDDAKNAHVNRCLEPAPVPVSVPAVARSSSTTGAGKDDVSEVCPVCAISLDDMPARSRTIHVNRCADASAAAAVSASTSAAASAPVGGGRPHDVACPLCARSLVYAATGAVLPHLFVHASTHLQQCGRAHGLHLPQLVNVAAVRARTLGPCCPRRQTPYALVGTHACVYVCVNACVYVCVCVRVCVSGAQTVSAALERAETALAVSGHISPAPTTAPASAATRQRGRPARPASGRTRMGADVALAMALSSSTAERPPGAPTVTVRLSRRADRHIGESHAAARILFLATPTAPGRAVDEDENDKEDASDEGARSPPAPAGAAVRRWVPRPASCPFPVYCAHTKHCGTGVCSVGAHVHAGGAWSWRPRARAVWPGYVCY